MSPGEGSASEPAAIERASAEVETADALRALEAAGWSPSQTKLARVEPSADGRSAVVFSLESRAGKERAEIEVVYIAEPTPMALVRAPDAKTRAYIEGVLTSSVPGAPGDASVDLDGTSFTPQSYPSQGCTPGCDAPAASCLAWSCTYTSMRGLSWGCLNFGNPLGAYQVFTRREGNTDPSRCTLPVIDANGAPHMCPAPSRQTNVLLCGAP